MYSGTASSSSCRADAGTGRAAAGACRASSCHAPSGILKRPHEHPRWTTAMMPQTLCMSGAASGCSSGITDDNVGGGGRRADAGASHASVRPAPNDILKRRSLNIPRRPAVPETPSVSSIVQGRQRAS